MTLTRKKKPVSANEISMPANILLNLIFIIAMVACLYPFLQVVGISFSDNASLRQYGYRLIPKVFSLEGYKYVFSSLSSIGRAYGITIFVTVVGTFLHLALTSMFAYPLTRPEFAFRKGFTVYVLITMLFGGGMVPWYIVCTQLLHLKNTIFALFVPSLFSAWNAIVLKTFIKNNIPDSLIESARLDGSTEFMTFLRIVLPLSKAGLATIGFMVALGFWNDWWLPLMLITDEKLYNLQYLLYRIMNQIQYLADLANRSPSEALLAMDSIRQVPQETARMAMCVITVGPIMFAFPFFQRHFVRGLTIGAVKG